MYLSSHLVTGKNAHMAAIRETNGPSACYFGRLLAQGFSPWGRIACYRDSSTPEDQLVSPTVPVFLPEALMQGKLSQGQIWHPDDWPHSEDPKWPLCMPISRTKIEDESLLAHLCKDDKTRSFLYAGDTQEVIVVNYAAERVDPVRCLMRRAINKELVRYHEAQLWNSATSPALLALQTDPDTRQFPY